MIILSNQQGRESSMKSPYSYLLAILIAMCTFLNPMRDAIAEDNVDIISSAQADSYKETVGNFQSYMSKFEMDNPGAAIWFPKNFWDGPSESDMGLKMYTMLFGTPATYAYWFVSNGKTDKPTTESITLATAYGSLMNSVGFIVVLICVGFNTIGFFAKRAVDVSYLSPEKEDEGSFIALKGTLGVITTYPLPFLGGMSTLQGLTLVVLMLGLGFSTSTIRFSVPWIISPNMVTYDYPTIHSVVRHVLRAKTCSVTLTDMAGKAYPNTLYISDKNSDPNAFNIVANFGPDSELSPSCGSITIGEYRKPVNLATNNFDAVSKYLTNQAIVSVGTNQITSLWNNTLLNELALKLRNGNLSSDQDFKSYYSKFNQLVNDTETQWTSDLTSEIKTRLDQNLGDGLSANEKYVNLIADVGFFGLASFYTALTVRQSDINQQIAKAYTNIGKPLWNSKDVSSEISTFTKFLNWFGIDVKPTQEQMLQIFNQTESFISVAMENNTNLTPKGKMDLAIQKMTEGTLGQIGDSARSFLTSSIIYATQATENGATFYNPLIELRRIGVTLQTTATLLTIASSDLLPTSTVMSTVDSALQKTIPGISQITEGLSKLIIVCTMVGLFLANVVPMLPYVIWVLAAFSYFSHSSIAVIGAGWWGAGFVTNTERNFSGNSKEGANILLTLGLKPFLMTISFFLAMLLNSILGYYITNTINAAATSAYYGTVNIYSFLGELFIYVLMLFIGMMKNLSLIWEMSDLCQRFIGFRNTLEDRTHSDTSSQVQQMSGSLGANIKAAMGGSGPKPISAL